MTVVNLLSISGGKDSTAMLLLAYERGVDARIVFADTGHEHPLTYEYLDYLNEWCRTNWSREIQTVRADFTRRLGVRRDNLPDTWANDVPADRIAEVQANLTPTGNPFLDAAKLYGMFPRGGSRWCTRELKINPIHEQVVEPLMQTTSCIIHWRGLRAQESPKRAMLTEKDVEFGSWEPEPTGLLIYRPLIAWTHEQVFDQHRKHGVRWNPLYEHGQGRVGCFPCIFTVKTDLQHMAARFPEQIDRVAQWEHEVALVAKDRQANFFSALRMPESRSVYENDPMFSPNVWDVVEWAKTGRGGYQYDLLDDEADVPSCSSVYGLCE